MTRRSSKTEGAFLLLAIVIALPVYLATKLFQTIGWVTPAVVVIAIGVFAQWDKRAKRQKRLKYLQGKYRDENVVQRVLLGHIWQGQTEEQLQDSLGPPVARDHQLLKTKTREVWKYQPSGLNRYRLRITVEDGRVAAWDQKN